MDEFEKERRLMYLDKEKTQLKKEQYIKEIKSGLGDHIKNSGNKIKIIKKSWYRRFINKLMKMF
jgi:argonaute-like protein implicated in RNA metabolism and viral defense